MLTQFTEIHAEEGLSEVRGYEMKPQRGDLNNGLNSLWKIKRAAEFFYQSLRVAQ
jgi:hypothetical protein